MACADCARTAFPFARAESPFVYGGAVADAVVALKHAGRLWAAPPLGRLLGPVLGRALQTGDAGGGLTGGRDVQKTIIVPVPLHPRRLRQRGYNQALELIRAARTFWDERATGGGVRLVVDVLRRIRDTPALGREPLPRRQARLRGAFVVSRPARVTGRRILIVDDVMTTGATFSACAEVLLGAGAISVHAVALARAQ